MPNAECRMTNDELMTKRKAPIISAGSDGLLYFVILASGFLRHSSFVIRHS
jgi:hypothetical protein